MKASVPQTSSIRVAALIRETPDGDRQTDRHATLAYTALTKECSVAKRALSTGLHHTVTTDDEFRLAGIEPSL